MDLDLINKARKGDMLDDPALKDYLFCMSKKIGFQNDDGDFQPDVIRDKLSDDLGDSDLDMLIRYAQQGEPYSESCCFLKNVFS